MFFKSEKCAVCKNHKGHRLCFRIGKDICWQDCNEMRVDQNCPKECEYAIQKSSDLQLKTKADSIREYQDLLTRQMNIWVAVPQTVFNGDIPREMSKTISGRKRLIEFLKQFHVNSLIPLKHLKSILSLDDLEVISSKEHYEDAAENFLQCLLLQEWEKTIPLLNSAQNYQDEELRENYLRRLSNNKFVQKIKSYFLISSALSENKKMALVYFEFNLKYDLTLVLELKDDVWKIKQKIFGKPEIANSELQANQQIAIMLSKNKLSEAFELLQKYSSIYVDSADLNYYWGMYYMFSNNTKRAAEFLFNAVELDPTFLEAKSLYATAILQEKQTEKAKKLFGEIIAENHQEIKSMNNLASIYIEEGKKVEAKKLLEKCLEIDPNFVYAKKNMEKV